MARSNHLTGNVESVCELKASQQQCGQAYPVIGSHVCGVWKCVRISTPSTPHQCWEPADRLPLSAISVVSHPDGEFVQNGGLWAMQAACAVSCYSSCASRRFLSYSRAKRVEAVRRTWEGEGGEERSGGAVMMGGCEQSLL